MKISNSYNHSLSKIFSPILFDSLANDNQLKIEEVSLQLFKSGILNSGELTLMEAIDSCYLHLYENYRSEYVFRNTIFQELVMKNHSFDDCIAISEFRVGLSKADLAVFNGTSTVYEIKTELDTINRLESQITDYSQFFDLIYIVTHHGFINHIEDNFSNSIGIYVLNESNTLTLHRKAKSNKINVSNSILMASLRMKEYSSIINNEYGYIPDVPNTRFYSECEKLFIKIDNKIAHDYVVKELLDRRITIRHEKMINELPESLKSISISKKYSDKQCDRILLNLNKII